MAKSILVCLHSMVSKIVKYSVHHNLLQVKVRNILTIQQKNIVSVENIMLLYLLL